MIDPVPTNRLPEDLPVRHRIFSVTLRSWLGRPDDALPYSEIAESDKEDTIEIRGRLAFLKMACYIERTRDGPYMLAQRGKEWIAEHERFLREEVQDSS